MLLTVYNSIIERKTGNKNENSATWKKG